MVAQLCILFFCTGLDAGAQTNSPKKIRVAYDVIFIGSPYCWATIASPFTTSLASYDFLDKTIVPFKTREGSLSGAYRTGYPQTLSESDGFGGASRTREQYNIFGRSCLGVGTKTEVGHKIVRS